MPLTVNIKYKIRLQPRIADQIKDTKQKSKTENYKHVKWTESKRKQ